MVNRRQFAILAAALAATGGCRGHQYAHVLTKEQDLVGSHNAGAET